MDAHNVAFVDFHIDFHGSKVTDVEDHFSCSESIALHAFPHFLRQGGHHPRLRSAKCGPAQVVFGFLDRSFCTANGEFSTPDILLCARDIGLGGQIGRLRLVKLCLGNHLLQEQSLPSLKGLGGGEEIGFALGNLGTGGGEVGAC